MLFFFPYSCLCSVGKSSTNLWLAGPHTKLVQTLIDSVLFLSNVYCQWWMYLFLVLPSPLQRIRSVCETEVEAGPPFFCFCFEDFKLRIKNETQNIAINHNLWSWLFFFSWEILFFPTQRKWSMAFNIFFLSYTWQSVGFLFHVWVFFYPCVLEFSLNDCTQGSWTLTPCVCLWTQAGHCDLLVQNGGYCIFSSLLSLGVATLLPFKNTFTQPKHAHNRHLSPPNGSVLTTLVTFLVLNHLSLPLSLSHDVNVFSVY